MKIVQSELKYSDFKRNEEINSKINFSQTSEKPFIVDFPTEFEGYSPLFALYLI